VNVNLKAFNKLDEETQQILIDVGREMEEIMWERVKQTDKKKESICNENGIISVLVSDELKTELNMVTREIREEWFSKAPTDALAIYNEFLKQVGR
ncbi:unnamed protein product, partial [marine sediment metagenome]